jgi:hypothetical protein
MNMKVTVMTMYTEHDDCRPADVSSCVQVHRLNIKMVRNAFQQHKNTQLQTAVCTEGVSDTTQFGNRKINLH